MFIVLKQDKISFKDLQMYQNFLPAAQNYQQFTNQIRQPIMFKNPYVFLLKCENFIDKDYNKKANDKHLLQRNRN